MKILPITLSSTILFGCASSTQNAPVPDKVIFTEHQHTVAQGVAFGVVCIEIYKQTGQVFEQGLMQSAVSKIKFPTNSDEKELTQKYIDHIISTSDINEVRSQCDEAVVGLQKII